MIKFANVTFGYSSTQPIFDQFSWSVESCERWVVIGPSGCGKSTLLYLTAGLVKPVSGEIHVEGNEITRPRPLTGLIIQDYGLLPWASVRQNVELGLHIRGFYGPDGIHAPANFQDTIKSDVDFWLKRLGLEQVADRYPNKISGGQRQRTALARTLVLKPDLLLMDEPFSSLDAPTRDSLQSLTLELCGDQNLTLVLVTHSIEEAVTMGEKILVLSPPPNRTVNVISNSGSLRAGFRETPEYISLCRQIRGMLETT